MGVLLSIAAFIGWFLLEIFGELLGELVSGFLFRIVFYLLCLVLATPFIFINALVNAGKYGLSVVSGYKAVHNWFFSPSPLG